MSENDLSLKMYFDATIECKRFVEQARARGYTTNAAVVLQLPFADECMEGIEQGNQEFGTTTVYSDTFALETTDFRSVLAKVKQANPNVILMLAYEDHATNFLKQKNELNIATPLFCGGTHDCFTQKVVDSIPKQTLEGFLTFNYNVRSEFIQRYHSLYPDATETELQAAAEAYDATQYLVRAILQCPTKDGYCIVNSIKGDKDYTSVVVSNGFGEDRVFHMQSQQEVFDGEKFVPIEG